MKSIPYILDKNFILLPNKARTDIMRTLKILTITSIFTLLFYSCDKNESAPQIVDQEFSIEENSAFGTLVGTIIASDADEGQVISFEIVDGNEEHVFAIEASSGSLSVRNEFKLDYESITQFTLKVVVSDNHKSDPLESSTIITVDVLDVNESAPVINNQSFDLDENPESGLAIGTLQATDEESHQQLTYSMTPRGENGFVSIEPATGVISVLDPEMFDYESRESFWIEVVVQDDHEDSMSDTAIITININDALEITDGLVAFYPFIGNANDSSGNAIHGQENGATLTTDRNGASANAFLFDGTDDYIELLDAAELHFADKDFSISLWYELTNMEMRQGTFFSMYSAAGSKRELQFGTNRSQDSIHFAMYHNASTERDLAYIPKYSGWNQVTVTKTSTEIRFYINGTFVEAMPVTGSMIPTSARVMIGAVDHSSTSPDAFFDGKLDDIYFHNRALEDWEIANLSQNK